MRVELDIGDKMVQIDCPTCSSSFEVKAVDLLTEGFTMVCPKCGQTFRSKGGMESLTNAFNKVERMVGQKVRYQWRRSH